MKLLFFLLILAIIPLSITIQDNTSYSLITSVFANFAFPLSVVEINDSTANGPTLVDNDNFGKSIANLGDLNGDGVNDIGVGAFGGDTGIGAVHILFLNTDDSVKNTVEINSTTTNGPTLIANDNFGSSIANLGDLDNDGVMDIAVGAVGDDDGGSAKGAVHILFLDTDGFVKSIAKINSTTTNGPTLDVNDSFGSSIANLGDLDNDGIVDIGVGAFGDDGGRGAVHILFLNTDGSVKDTAAINSTTTAGPTLDSSDNFGGSIANLGDLNHDGINDIAIGAIGDDGSIGAVHILFLNTDGSIDSTVEINNSTANGPTLISGDNFGSSITNLGDLDGDGVVDIGVGAIGDNGDGNNKGTAHILFLDTDGSVKSTVEINDSTANGPTLDDLDLFGSSIANLGDLDNDGVTDIGVGAVGDDNSGSGRGAVHIINLNTISTSGNALVDHTFEINNSTIPGSPLDPSDEFGRSIANLGDLDNDGINDIAVGAIDADAVHILFLNSFGGVDNTFEINNSTIPGSPLDNGDWFGSFIANLGDLDGDGVVDIGVGAEKDDGDGNNVGAVHILFLDIDGSVKSTFEINNSTANGPTLITDDSFGSSIANLGDLNGDGVTDIAVGAEKDDNAGGFQRGAVHILFLEPGGTGVDSTFEINGTTTNGPILSGSDFFGSSVTNLGDLDNDGVTDIGVGAEKDDTVHILFLNANGTVKSTVEINDSTIPGSPLDEGDLFGTSIANIGDLNNDGVIDIAVGASVDDNGGSNRGAVHILFLNTDGLVDNTVEINDSTTNGPTLDDGNFFGTSITNLGDLNGDGVDDIAVGAEGDDAVHILFLDKTTIVTNVTSLVSDATFLVGEIIDILMTFSESVLVTGLPQLTLETGTVDRAVDFTDGNNTSVLRFNYTVQPGDTSADLAYLSTSSLSLNGGSIEAVASPSDDSLVDLQIPGILSSLSFNKDIVVDGGTVPTSEPTKSSSGGSAGDSTAPVYKSGIFSDTTTIIKTGKTVSFTFEFYENSGPQKIQHAEFVTAIDKTQKISDSELFVEFDKSKEMVIVDKQSLWSTIPTVTIDDTGVNTKITFEMTFEKPMDVSDVILRVWDFKRNSVDERFENALQVIESKTTLTLPKDEIAENPVSSSDDSTSVVTEKVDNYIKQWAGYDNTSITGKQLLEKLEIPGNNIPSWYSFNAKMVKEGKISVDEFIISLQHLSDRNILG